MGKSYRKKKNPYNRKRPASRLIQPILLGLGVLVLSAAALSIYFSQEEKIAQLRKENETLTEQAGIEEDKKQELKELLDNWQTPEYIEKIAREEFGLVRPDEIIFQDH